MNPHRVTTPMLLLGAAFLAGCSGSGPAAGTSTPLDSAFRARANAVCAESWSARGEHPFPLKNFNPHKPDASRLPAVAAYFSTYGQAGLVADRLTALGEPQRAASEWDRMRSVITQQAENAKDQIRTAGAADVTAFKSTVDRADALHAQLTRLEARLGFSGSSPCGKLFS